MKLITPTQYGKIVGLKLNAVTKRIRDNKNLPGVEHVTKHSRFYLLEVEDAFVNKNINIKYKKK